MRQEKDGINEECRDKILLPLHVNCGVSVLTSQNRTVVSPEPLAKYLEYTYIVIYRLNIVDI